MKLKNVLIGASFMIGFATPVLAQPMMGPPPPNAAGHFDTVDLNRDGSITRDEVRAAHIKKFTQIDANRDNILTKEEMKAHHDAQRGNRMDKMADRRMNHIDENKDGFVTRQEWLNGPERARKLMQDRMAKRFDELDVNKDGKLSEAELGNMRMGGKMMGGHHDRHDGFKGKMVEKREMVKRFNPDTNNDGKITRAEWEAMPMPLFDKGDLNKDGKITREEAQQATGSGRGNMGGFKPRN